MKNAILLFEHFIFENSQYLVSHLTFLQFLLTSPFKMAPEYDALVLSGVTKLEGCDVGLAEKIDQRLNKPWSSICHSVVGYELSVN